MVRASRRKSMTEHTLQQKLIAEFIGTLFLTYTVCLTAVWGSSGDFHPGFAIAATLMAMIYSLGHISGAHFNPAVTTRIKNWVKKTMSAMGDALLSEKSKTVPPNSGEQPYKDTPKKGVL